MKRKAKRILIYPEQMLGLLGVVYFLYEKYRDINLFSTPEHWVVFSLCAALFFLRSIITFLVRGVQRVKLSGANIEEICRMKGITFEEYCKIKFEELGYQAKTTPKTHDYGADLILKKRGCKTAVQCKRYNAKIGIAAIQQAIGAKGFYKTDRAMVVTNSFFTQSAKDLARANDVELWDRNKIRQMFVI